MVCIIPSSQELQKYIQKWNRRRNTCRNKTVYEHLPSKLGARTVNSLPDSIKEFSSAQGLGVSKVLREPTHAVYSLVVTSLNYHIDTRVSDF